MKHVEGSITKDTKLLGRKEILLSHLRGKVLDIGCGEGELLIKAKLLGHDILGLDRSLKEISVAKQTAKESGVEPSIVYGSTECLPFQLKQFDTIVMGEVIEHLENPADTIRHVLTFLKDDGQLLITMPSGFAHPDADHKNFFFKQEIGDLLHKYWVWDFLPTMWLNIHKIIMVEKFFNNFPVDVEINEIEYGDSKHPSFDFFVRLKKIKEKQQ